MTNPHTKPTLGPRDRPTNEAPATSLRASSVASLPSSDLVELPASGVARHLVTAEASVSLASYEEVYAASEPSESTAAPPEDEITEEMIEAGAEVLMLFEVETTSESYWAEKVYVAMRRAAANRSIGYERRPVESARP